MKTSLPGLPPALPLPPHLRSMPALALSSPPLLLRRFAPPNPSLAPAAAPALPLVPAGGLPAPRRWPLLLARRPTAAHAARPSSPAPDIGGGDGPRGDGSAAAVASAAPGELLRAVELGLLFGMWYLCNIHFNIYNKQILKVFPFPYTMSACQFVFGSVFAIGMWTTGLYQRPKVSSSMLLVILPLAVVHTVGNLFTNISLLKVSVSFTHTIKAMEPFFTVVLSAMFLGERPGLLILGSLFPIVGGVALASLTEVSFNWYGFWSAMGSNLMNQYRNVLSKKLMVKEEESLDNITMFSIITIMSLLLSIPLAFVVEGVKFTPTNLQSLGLNVQDMYTRTLLAGISFHAYQQISYMILSKVSPVTHSVGNCVKRVVVIVSAVLFFRTPVSPVNALGTGVALLGVFLYSRAKRIKGKTA